MGAVVWMLLQVEVDSQVFEATIVGWSEEQLMQAAGLGGKTASVQGISGWRIQLARRGARIIPASQKITTLMVFVSIVTNSASRQIHEDTFTSWTRCETIPHRYHTSVSMTLGPKAPVLPSQ